MPFAAPSALARALECQLRAPFGHLCFLGGRAVPVADPWQASAPREHGTAFLKVCPPSMPCSVASCSATGRRLMLSANSAMLLANISSAASPSNSWPQQR
jgi:hypothetical protein